MKLYRKFGRKNLLSIVLSLILIIPILVFIGYKSLKNDSHHEKTLNTHFVKIASPGSLVGPYASLHYPSEITQTPDDKRIGFACAEYDETYGEWSLEKNRPISQKTINRFFKLRDSILKDVYTVELCDMESNMSLFFNGHAVYPDPTKERATLVNKDEQVSTIIIDYPGGDCQFPILLRKNSAEDLDYTGYIFCLYPHSIIKADFKNHTATKIQ